MRVNLSTQIGISVEAVLDYVTEIVNRVVFVEKTTQYWLQPSRVDGGDNKRLAVIWRLTQEVDILRPNLGDKFDDIAATIAFIKLNDEALKLEVDLFDNSARLIAILKAIFSQLSQDGMLLSRIYCSSTEPLVSDLLENVSSKHVERKHTKRRAKGRPPLSEVLVVQRLAFALLAIQAREKDHSLTWKEIARQVKWPQGSSQSAVKSLQEWRKKIEQASPEQLERAKQQVVLIRQGMEK